MFKVNLDERDDVCSDTDTAFSRELRFAITYHFKSTMIMLAFVRYKCHLILKEWVDWCKVNEVQHSIHKANQVKQK